MGTINKFRLRLLATMLMVAVNAIGQESIKLEPNELTFSSKGGEKIVTLTFTSDKCEITWDGSEWIHISGDVTYMNGKYECRNSPSEVIITADQNEERNARKPAYVFFSDGESGTKILQVHQNGTDDILKVKPDEVNLDYFGDTKTINIACDDQDTPWAGAVVPINLYDDVSWLQLNKESGTGTDNIVIIASHNPNLENREAYVIFSTVFNGEDITDTLTVKQNAIKPHFETDLNGTYLRNQLEKIDAGGTEIPFGIIHNMELIISCYDTEGTELQPANWFRVDPTDVRPDSVENKETECLLIVDVNPSLKSRKGRIIINNTKTGETQEYNIVQLGNKPYVENIGERSFRFSASESDKTEELTIESNVTLVRSDVVDSETGEICNWIDVTEKVDQVINDKEGRDSGKKTFYVRVLSTNNTEKDRVAKFDIYAVDDEDNRIPDLKEIGPITIIQTKKDVDLDIEPRSRNITVPAKGNDSEKGESIVKFTITSNASLLTLTKSVEWIENLSDTEFKASGVERESKVYSLTVTKNTGLNEREGKIYIWKDGNKEDSITIYQRGTSPYVSTKHSPSVLAASANSADYVEVESNVTLKCDIAGMATWLKVTPLEYEHNDATEKKQYRFDVSTTEENPSGQSRETKFIVKWINENGKQDEIPVSVRQSGTDTYVKVTPSSIYVQPNDTTITLEISGEVEASIKALNNTDGEQEWFKLSKTGKLSKNDKVVIQIFKNPSLKERQGYISLVWNGEEVQNIVVKQNRNVANVYPTTRTEFVFDAKKGEGQTLKIKSNVSLELSKIDEEWLYVTPDKYIQNDATQLEEYEFKIELKDDNNDDNDRTATFNINYNDENGVNIPIPITVTQNARGITCQIITPASRKLDFEPKGKVDTIRISSNIDLNIKCIDNIDNATNKAWFRLDKDVFESKGITPYTEKFIITVETNTDLKQRSGKISLMRGDTEMNSISVTQQGSHANPVFNNSIVTKNSSAFEDTIRVISNVTLWLDKHIDYFKGQKNWLEVTPDRLTHVDATKTDTLAFIIKGSANELETDRSAKFKIYWNDENDVEREKEITVNQYGKNAAIVLSTTTVSANATDKEKSFTITSNVNFSLEETDNEDKGKKWFWIETQKEFESSTDPYTITVKFDKNPGLVERNGKIIVYRNGNEASLISVKQSGTDASVSFKNTEFTINTDAFTNKQTQGLTVKSNVSLEILDISDDWLTVTPPKISHEDATETKEMIFVISTASDNKSDEDRKATFHIKWTNEKGTEQYKLISVTQLGFNAALTVNPGLVYIGSDENNENKISVNYANKWTAKIKYNNKDKDWIKLSLEGGTEETDSLTSEGYKDITIHATENQNNGLREAVLEITGQTESAKKEIPITQEGNATLMIKSSENNTVLLKYDTITVKKQDFSFYIDSNLNDSVNGWKWTVTCDEEWIHLKDADGNEMKNLSGTLKKTVKLRVDENEDNENRSCTIKVAWKNGLDSVETNSFAIVQRHKPEVPKLELVKYLDVDPTEPTIGQETTLTLNTDENHFNIIDPSYDRDISKRWKFIWTVNGDVQKNDTDSLKYSFAKKQKYTVTVQAQYKDLETIKSDPDTLDIFPAPKTPTGLQQKGNGTSGIMIASIDGLSDDLLKRDEYKFVFGTGNIRESDTLSTRYYQFKTPSVVTDDKVNKWVYTVWHYNDGNKTVLSKKRYNTLSSYSQEIPKEASITRSEMTQGINAIHRGNIVLINGWLRTHSDIPSKAVVTILSLNGTLVKRMVYSASRDFDEQIDLSGLQGGMYILRCEVGNERCEEKIVVK